MKFWAEAQGIKLLFLSSCYILLILTLLLKLSLTLFIYYVEELRFWLPNPAAIRRCIMVPSPLVTTHVLLFLQH